MNSSFETGGSSLAKTHDWLTPRHILDALGQFDLDPCASKFQRFRTAKNAYTVEDDGLRQPWHGRVWCNPPYGRFAALFLQRLSDHGNGVALIFARTDTESFHHLVFARAQAIYFLKKRVRFIRADSGQAVGNAGAPSCLIAYGSKNVRSLERSGLEGKLCIL